MLTYVVRISYNATGPPPSPAIPISALFPLSLSPPTCRSKIIDHKTPNRESAIRIRSKSHKIMPMEFSNRERTPLLRSPSRTVIFFSPPRPTLPILLATSHSPLATAFLIVTPRLEIRVTLLIPPLPSFLIVTKCGFCISPWRTRFLRAPWQTRFFRPVCFSGTRFLRLRRFFGAFTRRSYLPTPPALQYLAVHTGESNLA